MQPFEMALKESVGQYTWPMTDHDRDAVRDAVCAFVDHAKKLNWPPERVLARVKEIVQEAGMSAPSGMVAAGLMSAISEWCIERYFLRGS